MRRRLATLLLSAAMILASVLAGPCMSSASCPLAQGQQIDCCKGPGAGISAPRCCDGRHQVGRTAPPATAERQVHSGLAAPAMPVAPVAVEPTDPSQLFAPQRVDAATAPPGGTLVAQHTSLLL
jgi:hypothetical protein